VDEIRKMIEMGFGDDVIAVRFNISAGAIRNIRNGKSWAKS
jgi:hypothetical protein